jgi:hypothetical protein
MVRVVWRCDRKADAARLSREMRPLALGDPPMVSPFGRTRDTGPSQLMSLRAIGVERGLVDPGVRVSVETV